MLLMNPTSFCRMRLLSRSLWPVFIVRASLVCCIVRTESLAFVDPKQVASITHCNANLLPSLAWCCPLTSGVLQTVLILVLLRDKSVSTSGPSPNVLTHNDARWSTVVGSYPYPSSETGGTLSSFKLRRWDRAPVQIWRYVKVHSRISSV